MKKIIKKIKLSYYNIILGGFFGVLRSILLIFLFLFIFNYFNQNGYIYYIHHSMLISILVMFKKYFLLFFSLF
ncbi:CvpA family protein [Buchnera aphidicola]|uniref:Uncharacterized protein n=1 Tax=Buchnera aphidicola (Macrosiphum gaurae) TaxID=2315801 RepID=A0A4D6XYZ2_9GAMM|nr:CvpA family protein [Buchnera aphidicola]QCI22626.1 hypothetical protein D9V72_00845 [Buchnera aphidicola (Macrosiphum gaurae)]